MLAAVHRTKSWSPLPRACSHVSSISSLFCSLQNIFLELGSQHTTAPYLIHFQPKTLNFQQKLVEKCVLWTKIYSAISLSSEHWKWGLAEVLSWSWWSIPNLTKHCCFCPWHPNTNFVIPFLEQGWQGNRQAEYKTDGAHLTSKAEILLLSVIPYFFSLPSHQF